MTETDASVPVKADLPAPSEPPAPPAAAAPRAEASRNFGPDWEGERTNDVEVVAKGDAVEALVGEFAGSITGIGVVNDDVETPLKRWSAEPGEVGTSLIKASGVGDGPVVLRLHISS